ncbi:MAG: serine hydrolase [Bryobacteraceae bacterium]
MLAAILFVLLAAAPAGAQRVRRPQGPEGWPKATPQEAGMDAAKLARARDYALGGGGSGIVIHEGKQVYAWGDLKVTYDLKSTTKSIGVTALGLALADGKVKLADLAKAYLPELGVPPEGNRRNGWLDRITLFHLATQTAGFEKPGGFEPLLFAPGSKWSYSDGGPNWLADALTRVYRRDLEEVLFERVFTPLGIRREELRWRENAYRPKTLDGIARREFGSGVHSSVDAMARIGYLYLNAGRILSRQVLPPDFVAMARQPVEGVQGLPVLRGDQYPDASNRYSLLWWNNGNGALENVPRDAYWSWGLYDSHIIVVPSLDLVIARAGKSPDGESGARPERIRPLIEPVVAAVDPVRAHIRAPYPRSPVIEAIEWAPPRAIRRLGSDCDNFPSTWADDDHIYTAHGDCRGFYPLRPRKLGLGFARITGGPDDFEGVNIPSESGDNTGQGPEGRKASGMLMVDGVLYLWARNAGNSQLAWSTDRARAWTWSDWKFTTSFGHPAFLNFGRNYAGARDGFVYIYSPDGDSAYEPAARMVLARVPRDRIRERGAYEFFRALDGGRAAWTKDIARRGPVFSNPPAGVYRTQVSYNAGLRRYLMNQILAGGDGVRFQGGFGVYDAPEPWGPWTTAYFTPMWDVGPGENQHLPPKWMSADGRTLQLIFSGDDVFSVRRATVRLYRSRR